MKQPYPFFPGDTLDLAWLWLEWLEPTETISNFTIVAGPNLVVNSSSGTSDTVVANTTLHASTKLGNETWLRCTIVTNKGRTVTRALRVISAVVTVEGDPE